MLRANTSKARIPHSHSPSGNAYNSPTKQPQSATV